MPGYNLQSPWTSMQDLQDLLGQSAPNASFDPSVQANINTQTMNQPDLGTALPFQLGGGMNPSAPPPSPTRASSSMRQGPDMSAINRLLGQMDTANSDGFNTQKAQLDRLSDYRDKMPQGSAGMDLTGLMALADNWGDGKNNFASTYKRPDTADERASKKAAVDMEIAKAAGGLSKDELATLKDRLTGEVAKLHYGIQKDQMSSQKASDNEEKDANNLIKFLDTERTGGRMAAVVKAQGNIFQAERLQALIDKYKSNPDEMPLQGVASLSEVAIGLNSLLAANGGSEESRKSLLPASARGKFSTIEQWIQNKPVGAEMSEFVKNAEDTLARERSTNAKQVNTYKERIHAATNGGRLARANPERYGAIMNAFISPQDVSNASLEQSAPASGASGNGLPPSVEQHGYKYNLGSDGKYHRGDKL